MLLAFMELAWLELEELVGRYPPMETLAFFVTIPF